MTSIVNQISYLRTSREFPQDATQLCIETGKAYIDTANAVNNRTISIFPTNRPAVNGESWFINSSTRNQGLRQVYTFTTLADIPIGFKLSTIAQPVRLFGMYNDGPLGTNSWFGLINGTSVAIAGQILMFVFNDTTSTTTDVIRFVDGGGAPGLDRGFVVLEWISNT